MIGLPQKHRVPLQQLTIIACWGVCQIDGDDRYAQPLCNKAEQGSELAIARLSESHAKLVTGVERLPRLDLGGLQPQATLDQS